LGAALLCSPKSNDYKRSLCLRPQLASMIQVAFKMEYQSWVSQARSAICRQQSNGCDLQPWDDVGL